MLPVIIPTDPQAFQHYMSAIQNICSHLSLIFKCSEICSLDSVNIVEIITETHASGFSDCQIVNVYGKKSQI